MSIRFQVPQRAEEQVALTYSPALEAVLSLHILVEPKHHPLHHQWVRATRARLTPASKRLIAGFRFAHSNYLPPPLLPEPTGGFPTFESELERLRGLGLERIGLAILKYFVPNIPVQKTGRANATLRQSVLAATAGLGPSTVALVALGLEQPEELADRFLVFLTRYFEEAGLRAEWERIEPRLAETVTEAGRRIARDGLYAMLEQLRPKLGVDRKAGGFWVRKAHEEEIVVGEDSRLVLVPSAFLWPHIALVQDPPDRLGLVYPAPFASHDIPAELPTDRLLPVLRALANDTRLRTLKLIAQSPRSTQELALLLGITEAGLSKHLRQLTTAGIVETHREGYYVLYSLVRDQVAPLSASLLAYLDKPNQPHAPSHAPATRRADRGRA